MSNVYRVSLNCPSCRRDVVISPTNFSGPYPIGGDCPLCGAGLSWPIDSGLILTGFEPTAMTLGQVPTGTITVFASGSGGIGEPD